jgi:2-amino-4-hydroxy-6-hydroxymethyldihydropteridine diphosphokinase
MVKTHKFYLSLGSNIDPKHNLPTAVRKLSGYGTVVEISSVWESHPVGSDGPNFLNLCVGFSVALTQAELKQRVVGKLERELGRQRSDDKNAPRTIDIDIVMEDGVAVDHERWSHPYVILPMAELLPDFPHPASGRRMAEQAIEARASMWIQRRPEELRNLAGSS